MHVIEAIHTAYLLARGNVADGNNFHHHLLCHVNPILWNSIWNTRMIEQPARQREDAMGKGSQMTVDRKVVVSATRKQLISRLHRAVTSGQWTGRRRVRAVDRTW